MDCLTFRKSNCKNCYKCIRNCPVKSIKFSSDQANIIGNECIMCGECFVVCPQNAKQIKSSVEAVESLLDSGARVYASLAPSFVANYEGADINSMKTALKALEFYDAEETAVGAAFVKTEYENILNEGDRDVLISSCCHSVNLLIQKYFPDLLGDLAAVLSPMQAHAKRIKEKDLGAKVVFIGPCVAKKDETEHYAGFADEVLTFEELSQMLDSNGVELKSAKPERKEDIGLTRLFPTTGGILKTMAKNENYAYVAVDGVKNVIETLKSIRNGEIHRCFIEMSACVGSCVGGPVMEKHNRSHVKGYLDVTGYAGKGDFKELSEGYGKIDKTFEKIGLRNPVPLESEIQAILKQMGKDKPENVLNCGSCGYDTCRDKAIAVYQGKAEISMCLPYLKEKAESFSDSIVSNSLNGIIVLNDKLEIIKANESAKRILGEANLVGEGVQTVMDALPFLTALEKKASVKNERVKISRTDKWVVRTVLYDFKYGNLICVMRDVTSEEAEKLKKDELREQTISIADKVVEKQMRVVQEIASLLGETTAETKIALTKLKESIKDE